MFRSRVFLSLALLASLGASTVQASERIRLVHFNIRELDSAKLLRGQAHPQIRAVKEVMSRYPFDIFSVNELHYDLPGVPARAYQSRGENLYRLLELVDGFGAYSYFTSFDPANTGRNALRKPDGDYEVNPNAPGAYLLADPVNFGSFPAEYSTGAATRFPILAKKVFSRVLWKAFRPDRDLSQFRDGFNQPLNTATVELFDKNFTDLTLNVGGKAVHLILFHAVPAFNFGNPFSMNDARNHDQLAFLEWYLTGATSFPVPAGLLEPVVPGVPLSGTEIFPLPPGSTFIAVGDWNADVTDATKPSAEILKRLYEHFNPWMRDLGVQTFQGSSFDPATYQAQLDYAFVSRDIRVLGGGVHAPAPNARDLGCDLAAPPVVQGPEREARSYVMRTVDTLPQTCWIEVDRDFAVAKDASDHRLLWAEFQLN